MSHDRPASPRRRSRRTGRLLLLGAAVAAPVVAHVLIQRRLRSPERPRWGRTHRFGGRHGEVVFQQLGSGPAVVLLHAFGPGYDAQQWQAAAEALASRFQVFVPDLPSWGRSAPTAPDPVLYLEVLSDFLRGAVRAPVILAAAGGAAPLALALAGEQGESVRAVALAAPEGLPDTWGGSPPASAARNVIAALLAPPLVREAVLDALTSRAALTAYLQRCVFAAPERVDAAMVEHHYRVSHLPAHRRALAAWCCGALSGDAEALLANLQVPVWIAWGARQPGIDRDTAAEEESQTALLPAGSRVDVLYGCGALPHAECASTWSAAFGRFADQLPA